MACQCTDISRTVDRIYAEIEYLIDIDHPLLGGWIMNVKRSLSDLEDSMREIHESHCPKDK